MPSRKKAKGQARKAARVKKEEELLSEKERKVEEVFRELEQTQIQRLQVNNQNSVPCMHGFDPFPDDHVCIKFIRAFVLEFYKCMREYPDLTQTEKIVIECLSNAKDSIQAEYSDVWNSADKIKQVISYFLCNGTVLFLEADADNCRMSAVLARFFEQWLKVKVHRIQACIDWPKVVESGGGDEHTVVKYFWRSIRCSCLDEKYEEVKSVTKMGICFNLHCAHQRRTVERSKLRCCSRCRSITYCSRECQVADWSSHKELCDKVAAAKAEFDASASQNQQS
jgi:hypothetical protein